MDGMPMCAEMPVGRFFAGTVAPRLLITPHLNVQNFLFFVDFAGTFF
jgi:hypothetical protein